MAVVHAPESTFSKEMAKWETTFTQYGPPGRQYTFQEYPSRLYKAVRNPDGSRTFEGVTVNDADEQRNFESRGFVAGGQQAALDALAEQEQEVAVLAANRNYNDRNMSERAQAEAAEVIASAGARHVAEIPEKPKRKYTRKVTE